MIYKRGMLVNAALKGDISRVIQLLKHPDCDIDEQDNNGYTALMVAVIKRHLQIVILLVEGGANICLTDPCGNTPLDIAKRKEFWEIIKVLESIKSQGQLLYEYCSGNDIQKVSLLLERGVDPNSYKDSATGETALMLAVKNGNLPLLQLLLQYKADVLETDNKGRGVVRIAVESKHDDVIMFLLNSNLPLGIDDQDREDIILRIYHDCDVKIMEKVISQWNKKTSQLDQYLLRACQDGRIEFVKLFLAAGADINAQDKQEKTAYDYAATDEIKILLEGRGCNRALFASIFAGNLSKVCFILSKGANSNSMLQGGTPLSIAISMGNKEIIKLLLKYGADVNIKAKGETPLIIAVKRGLEDIVRLLLAHCAKVNIPGNQNLTPLHVAISSKNSKIIKLLLEHGADVNMRDDRYETPLFEAARIGNIEVCRLLIEHGAHFQIENIQGDSPLSLAVQGNYIEIVKLLISKDGSLNKEYGLCIASKLGYTEIVKLLLQYKANVNTKMRWGDEPLFLAVQGNHVETVRMLLNGGAEVNVIDMKKRTPFDYAKTQEMKDLLGEYGSNGSLLEAVKTGKVDRAKAALIGGADVNMIDGRGRTPFFYATTSEMKDLLGDYGSNGALLEAAKMGDLTRIEAIVSKGADIHGHDSWGWTPLHICAKIGNKECSKWLLDHGANVNAQFNSGFSPLHIACKFGHIDLARLLLETGADVNSTACIEHSVKNPFDYASTEKMKDLLREYGSDGALVQAAKTGDLNKLIFILSKGANINGGWVVPGPLHAAVKEGHIEIVEYLLDHGANIDWGWYPDTTPIDIACKFGHIEIVKMLLARGAQIYCNKGELNGSRYALCLASLGGHTAIVKLLLEHGVDINVTYCGNTALEIAKKRSHADIIALLRQYGAKK